MGSLQNSPDPTSLDCSAGICSIYCPKWCFTVFSPPPQPPDAGPGAKLPVGIIALIVILVGVFIVVSCYCLVCMQRRRNGSENDPEAPPGEWRASANRQDDLVIKAITVFQYWKGDKLVEGTECSVCLSEFEEGENLKLMPKCCHAFHPQCIDTWLKSQVSNAQLISCPLCRAGVNPYSPVNSNPRSSVAFNVSSLQVWSDQNQLVTHMVEDNSQVMEVSASDAIELKNLEEGRFRGPSISSLGSFSSDRRLLVDIARSDGEIIWVGTEDGVSRGYPEASFDSALHDRA